MRMLQRYYQTIFDTKTWQENKDRFVFVDITNAGRWYVEDKQVDEISLNDFPHITPPWPAAWMEYNGDLFFAVDYWPSVYLHMVKASRYALITETTEVTSAEESDNLMRDLGGHVAHSFGWQEERATWASEQWRQHMANEPVPCTARWFMRFILLGELEKKAQRIAEGCIPIAASGQAIQQWIASFSYEYRPESGFISFGHSGMLDKSDEWGMHLRLTFGNSDSHPHALLYPFLFAISLLHCKNITLADIPVPPRLEKARAKRGVPSITYKTLIVNPLHQQIRREMDADPDGEQNTVKRALHIVRGHFADYTKGNGLFGKKKGIFWIPMHSRGELESGMIIKDYKVKR